jgi:hypothetical protein
MPVQAFTHSAFNRRTVAAIALTSVALALASPASAAAPAGSIAKVVNGKFTVQADNGWVAYQDQSGTVQPSLRRYAQDANGVFTASAALKLKTVGAGLNGNGAIFNLGGVAFAPCPTAGAPTRCGATDFGTEGVGLAFGQSTFGGAGSAAAGWVNDATLTTNFTDVDFNTPGSVSAVSIDPTNGAYAVGWSISLATGSNHGVVLTLDSAGLTYKVTARKDLGTLGGLVSQVLAMSKNAAHVVGIADDSSGTGHAVYAAVGAAGWTDISGGLAPDTIKSRALAVSNTGIVGGSATVKRVINGAGHSVDIGFTFNTNTSVLTVFEVPGANVIPLKVLDDGRMVGNLEFINAPGVHGLTEMHPFMWDGTMHDFGTMTLANGQKAFSCRVNRPNNLGELAGSCIPSSSIPYGVQGSAFYINAVAPTPVFIDVNAMLHANADSTNSFIKPYVFGTVTSIDDQHEITMIAVNKTGSQGGFIASKPAYNP